MKVVILHGEVPPDAPLDEQDALAEVQTVRDHLADLGFEAIPMALGLGLDRTLQALTVLAPDVVFNLVESVHGDTSLAYLAPALLDHARLPYTGCPTDAVYVTSNKVLTKRILAGAGLPTLPCCGRSRTWPGGPGTCWGSGGTRGSTSGSTARGVRGSWK